MPNRSSASRRGWLFCCAILVATCGTTRAAETADSPEVTVESWVVEVSLADRSRRVGLTPVGDLFATGVRPSSHSPAVIEFRSLAELGLTPDSLANDLENKRLGRVLTSAKLKLSSGQPGSLQVKGTSIDATATVNGEKIRLNYRFRSKEADPKLRDTVTGAPGYREQMADFAVELVSAKAVMLPLPTVPGKPLEATAVIVQATLSHASQKSLRSSTAETATKPDLASPNIPLMVKLRVIQIDNAKLRRLGFQWSQLAPNGETTSAFDTARSLFDAKVDPKSLDGFIEALRQHDLARVLAEPTLVTLSGRPASFAAGGTQLDLVPVLLDSGRVSLECHTKTANDSTTPGASGQFVPSPANVATHRFNTTTDVELGRVQALGVMRLPTTNARSPSQDIETIVLARVDRFTQ